MAGRIWWRHLLITGRGTRGDLAPSQRQITVAATALDSHQRPPAVTIAILAESAYRLHWGRRALKNYYNFALFP